MVRLKETRISGLEFGSKFQFHYGTIKSSDNYQQDSETTEFQFHYGTIKRNARIVAVLSV